MILTDIGMIAVANARSRAYITAMHSAGLYPAQVLLLNAPASPGSQPGDSQSAFLETLASVAIPFELLASGDINDPLVIAAIRKRGESYFIYSGAGGVLLKNPLLSCGKKFIHVHPGKLPDFRGSTTVYYHLLAGNTCTASAIFLEEKIDAGAVLRYDEYPFPFGSDIDLDYDFDPKIRAATLVKLLQDYAQNNRFPEPHMQNEGGETYFIMHPVLRHLARLRLLQNQLPPA